MRRLLVAWGAIAAIAGTGCAQTPPLRTVETHPTAPAQRLFPADSEVQAVLDSLVAQGRVKGIAVGLIEPDGSRRTLFAGDTGANARPVSADTVFELGSLNKTFTGTLLADAVRRGEVSLDDPVAKYLPSQVRVPSRNGREITLLDLATHSSGLPRIPTGYAPPDPADPYAAFGEAELYAFLSGYTLEREIGATPEYSNLGMGLLGHALARAAGAETYADLVRARILEPLGMERTAFPRRGEADLALATGHDADGVPVPHWHVATLGGAGGLNAPLGDMLAYLEAQLGPPTRPIEGAMREAHQPRRPLEDAGWQIGLGWQVRDRDGHRLVSHGGGTAGFSTMLGFDPESGAGAVILANSAEFGARDELLSQLLFGGPVVTPPAGALADYAGTYRLRPGLDVTVAVRDGRLHAALPGQPEVQLFAAEDGSFYPLVAPARFRFARDPSGAVTGMTLTQGERSATGARVG
ncbi:serine hydrolase [Sphingosinithalassobacter sp. LHW66-3]|uniref:serine hydrolase n=1 Tax=Sphingosinithalassobacter sp. LHW66-3 TaxID=3424718 RepID=UPI003D6B5E31